MGLATGLMGCDGLQARKYVQEGNFLYKEARFEDAKVLFEKALALVPNLEIAHHNLGLTCAKLFKAGVDKPENTTFADCATHHIQVYLDRHPKENKLRDKMTTIWLNSGLYDKALSYWQDQFKVIPPDAGADIQKREITQRIAGINFKAGRWKDAMEWYVKAAELAPDGPGKVNSYQSVGNVAWATMRNRDKNYGDERIDAADRGLSALEKAAEIDPKKPEIRALIAALYNFRALAQGSAWGAAIERATAQDHDRRRRVLSEEAKKAQSMANGTGAAGANTAGSTAPAPPQTAKPGG
jgi:tetratricopeptide (TPR) repeat protein